MNAAAARDVQLQRLHDDRQRPAVLRLETRNRSCAWAQLSVYRGLGWCGTCQDDGVLHTSILSRLHAENINAKPLPASPACWAAGYTIGYYGRPFEARNKVGGTLGNLLAFSFDVCYWAMSNSRLLSHAYTGCRRRAAALRAMTKIT